MNFTQIVSTTVSVTPEKMRGPKYLMRGRHQQKDGVSGEHSEVLQCWTLKCGPPTFTQKCGGAAPKVEPYLTPRLE